MKPERKSFDTYTVALGVLAVGMLAIFAFSMKMSGQTADISETASTEYLASVAQRLRPFGDHYLPGEEASANMPTAIRHVALPLRKTMNGTSTNFISRGGLPHDPLLIACRIDTMVRDTCYILRPQPPTGSTDRVAPERSIET